MKRRTLILAVVIIALSAIGIWYWTGRQSTDNPTSLTATVQRSDFSVEVATTGELKAKKFVQIQGPPNAQAADAYQMKISTLVAEGTVVKAGELVAELDRSTITAKLTELQLAVQKAEAQYTQARLDTSMNLQNARNDMKNTEYTVEETRLTLEQATYEAPAVKRQAQINNEKAQRGFEQSRKNYQTKTQQAIAKMSEVGAELERVKNKMNVVLKVMEGFTIKAPSDGMVIYVKEWDGRKRGIGSQISSWSPTVATLPDLTKMESLTYVNEIDIRKITVGQYVKIGLDSDPEKKLTGKITSVANIGEQRPNSDSKVFEVKIDIHESDTTLRPGMTTSNMIIASTHKNVLHIPIEALHTDNGKTVVYKQSGTSIVRQEVKTGAMNENNIVIEAGVQQNDVVLLTIPANETSIKTILLQKSDTLRSPKPVTGSKSQNSNMSTK